jgi:hypothetical protein
VQGLGDAVCLLELSVHHPRVLDDGHALILWEAVYPLDGAGASLGLGTGRLSVHIKRILRLVHVE